MNSGCSSPDLVLVDHIVENQCCSVNYFDSGGSLKGFLWFPSQSFSRKHNQQGAATFSNSSEHVLDDLVSFAFVKIRLQCLVDSFLDGIAPGFKRRWKLSHCREPNESRRLKRLHRYLIGCGQHRKRLSNCM